MALNRKRTVKITFWILAALLVLSLLVVYLRYLDLKKVFLQKVSEKAALLIGQGVQIEDFSINSFLSANLYGISIKNPEGFAPGDLLRVRRVRWRPGLGSFLRGEISIKRIVLYSPELSLITNGKGKWNISEVLLRLLSTRSATRYEVDELRIDSEPSSSTGTRDSGVIDQSSLQKHIFWARNPDRDKRHDRIWREQSRHRRMDIFQ